jgi:uncharacterized protein (DUF58 family)
MPETLPVGEAGVVHVAVAATRHARPTRFGLLLEQQGAADPPEVVSLDVLPGEGGVAALPVRPRRRGRIAIDRLWLRWCGPLRLIEIIRRHEIAGAIDVVSNVGLMRGAGIEFYARDALFGLKTQRQTGEGAEFEALREYTPGLDTRFIDWKHSARHHKLVCKEFRTERNHPIILAFDTGYLMGEPLDGVPRLDHAISAGLALGWVSLKSGDLVGLYGFAGGVRQYVRPLQGVGNFARLQQATASLAYAPEETNFTLGLAALATRLKRRTLVILFTEFVDTVTAELLVESVQRVASRHVVVFVTLRDSLLQRLVDAPPREFGDVAASVVGTDLLRDRAIVLERLQRLGVHCLDVPSTGLSVALIDRYLRIKERGLL